MHQEEPLNTLPYLILVITLFAILLASEMNKDKGSCHCTCPACIEKHGDK